MKQIVLETISNIIPKENISFQVPMSKHTTFRVGGNTDVMIKIDKIDQLPSLISYLVQESVPYFILGNGSNILVSDQGYRGIMIQISSEFSNYIIEDTTIKVEAGAMLSKISKIALEQELTGMEFASGIPGSIGGAMIMNAGAYGGEMSQIVECIKVVDQSGNILTLNKEEIEFGYRTSIMKQKSLIVLEVTFRLAHGIKGDICKKMSEITAKRLEKQPVHLPSGGSTFKRPKDQFAGKLIMDAGLRGEQIGGAQVSELHCGFVVNTGTATATDVYQLIQKVQKTVLEKFEIQLELEIITVGEF